MPTFKWNWNQFAVEFLSSFFKYCNSSNIAKLISSSEVFINRKDVTYSLMFCTMFDLNTMNYIMEHIEFTKIMHPSREPLKHKGSYQSLCKNCCSHTPLLISSSETVKYLHRMKFWYFYSLLHIVIISPSCPIFDISGNALGTAVLRYTGPLIQIKKGDKYSCRQLPINITNTAPKTNYCEYYRWHFCT